MRCHDVQGLFSEIYDGVAEEQAALQNHLNECPTCAAEYEDYSRLINELRKLPMPELPDNFHETVMAKVREIAASQDSPASETIYELHKGQRLTSPAKLPKKTALSKANAITRRWAGVAAAACVLLVSLWAVRIFDLPGQQADTFALPIPGAALMESQAQAEYGASVYDLMPADDALLMPEDEEYAFIEIDPAAFNVAMDIIEEEIIQTETYQARIYDMDFAADADDYHDFAEAPLGVAAGAEAEAEWAAPEADTPDYAPLAPRFASDLPIIAPITEESLNFADDFRLPLTMGGPRVRTIAWGIAFAVGLATLGISLAAMFWSIHQAKQERLK